LKRNELLLLLQLFLLFFLSFPQGICFLLVPTIQDAGSKIGAMCV